MVQGGDVAFQLVACYLVSLEFLRSLILYSDNFFPQLLCFISDLLSTQVLYSLLTLGAASQHLSLDKYAIFYVCEIARSDRKTIVNMLEYHTHFMYLSKNESTITSSYEKIITKSEGCPPLVTREYRPHERRNKAADLAVIYEDKRSLIPGGWKNEYIQGRAFKRDTYQFAPDLTLPTIFAANALSSLAKERNALFEWAETLREQTEKRLQQILECYGFDSSYRLITGAGFRSSVFAGLVLFDTAHSKVHSFEIRKP